MQLSEILCWQYGKTRDSGDTEDPGLSWIKTIKPSLDSLVSIKAWLNELVLAEFAKLGKPYLDTVDQKI